MDIYYIESIWNESRGIEVMRIFKRGTPKHFAVFYDKVKAKKFLEMLNGGSFD